MNPFQIQIANPTDASQEYNLFGYNFNQNPNPNLQFQVSSGSFAELQRASQNTGLVITSLKFISNNQEQFQQPVDVVTKTITGYTNTYSIIPFNYLAPSNANNRVVEVKPVEIPITATVGFQGIILPSTNLTIVFNYKPITTKKQSYHSALNSNTNKRYKLTKYRNLVEYPLNPEED